VPADGKVVSPGYCTALDLRLVRGRDFTDADKAGAPRVAIVNEAFAGVAGGTPAAIGRKIELNDDPSGGWQQATIVGIAADARVIWLDARVDPYIYVPLAQRYTPRLALVVKNSGATSIPEMRTVIREINPDMPVSQAMPMTDVTALTLIPQRIAAGVAGRPRAIFLLLPPP